MTDPLKTDPLKSRIQRIKEALAGLPLDDQENMVVLATATTPEMLHSMFINLEARIAPGVDRNTRIERLVDELDNLQNTLKIARTVALGIALKGCGCGECLAKLAKAPPYLMQAIERVEASYATPDDVLNIHINADDDVTVK